MVTQDYTYISSLYHAACSAVLCYLSKTTKPSKDLKSSSSQTTDLLHVYNNNSSTVGKTAEDRESQSYSRRVIEVLTRSELFSFNFYRFSTDRIHLGNFLSPRIKNLSKTNQSREPDLRSSFVWPPLLPFDRFPVLSKMASSINRTRSPSRSINPSHPLHPTPPVHCTQYSRNPERRVPRLPRNELHPTPRHNTQNSSNHEESHKQHDRANPPRHGPSPRSMFPPSNQFLKWKIFAPPFPEFGIELPPRNLSQTEANALSVLSTFWDGAKRTFDPPLRPEEDLEYSDRAKVRYLRARDWDSKRALSMMVKNVIFRRKMNILNLEEVARLNQKGAIYRRGFDVSHRPILYIR